MRRIKVLVGFLATSAAFAGLTGCQKRGSPKAEVGQIGDPCQSESQCRSGLVCARSGTCQDPRTFEYGPNAEGASCDEENRCRVGLTCCDSDLRVVRNCEEGVCVRQSEEGEPCATTEDCVFGLACGAKRRCAPDGVGRRGDPCTTTADCSLDFVCSSTSRCTEPGEGGKDDPCVGPEECSRTLVCAGDGTCQDPEDPESEPHGMVDVGGSCVETAQCLRGLYCFVDGTCRAVPYWPGAYCEDESAQPFKVHFDIPALPLEGEIDFFSLPKRHPHKGGKGPA